MAFLGWRNQWEDFLRNLKYLIIDEMHEYRGFFGGNMALSLRRFFLHLDSIGANPRVFLSTATCANPKEHAENLTGRDVELVSARNVLHPRRHFLFVNPDVPDYRRREIIQLRVEQAALTVLSQGLQVLVFCPTKRFIEETLTKCWLMAEKNNIDPDRISAYHADMNSTEKRKIQRKIKNGSISVVFTTNALELGIDIGGLDGVILAGFPPNVMSAWQQIGRAGRGWDKEAFVLFYAMNDPIDQFFVGNLNAFLDKKLDALVVDPSNEGLIKKHLPSLTEETNGTLPASAKNILGPAFYDIAKENPGKPPRRRSRKPQIDLQIRGSFGQSYDLKFNDEKIGQISEMRLFREAYLGAIFTFFGKKYAVHAHEEDAVVLTEAEQHLKTEPSFYTKLVSLDPYDGVSYGDIDIHYGALDLSINFTGYKLIDEHNDEEIDSGSTGQSKYLNNLHAFWVYIPQGEYANEGIGGLEHIIRVGAMFVIPADRFDTTTYSTAGEEPVASYYENYPSGIGIAKKLYAVLSDVLKKGIDIAEKCGCPSGCQNCIEPAKSYDMSNADINKIRGIELAKNLLDVVDNEKPDHKWRNGGFVPV
jgi:DEAD/DEAH box helicase domain-containing protein